MSDIKLFRLTNGTATELQGNASDLEKPLQTLIEANLQPLLNIRFIASEHSTGKRMVVALTRWDWTKTIAQSSSNTSARWVKTSSIRVCFIWIG